jgi:hypothetical protein
MADIVPIRVPRQEDSCLIFQFRRGDRVRPHGVAWVGVVTQQRVTLRDVLSPVYEYLVQPPQGHACWYYEPDLMGEDAPHG